MVRLAAVSDLDGVEKAYLEHFAYEETHGAFTVFQKDVYPTRKDAEWALKNGTLYICEECGTLAGSMILDDRQPDEYERIHWRYPALPEKVRVIHLLMVRPCMAGRGIGSMLVDHAVQEARRRGCEVLRLDTGKQNIPASSLYQKMGFTLAETASMNVGGAIAHGGHLFFERKV